MNEENFNIKWDKTEEHLYHTGVDRVVLYVYDNGGYGNGVGWDGITAVNESPSGAEATALYANNRKYLDLISIEEFGGTIEAYTCPREFYACDGQVEIAPGAYVYQQDRKSFGLTYREIIGNDTEGNAHAYAIHIVYGAKVSPTEMNHETVNDAPDAATQSWEFSTTPVDVPGGKPTSHIKIESDRVSKAAMSALEAWLYGTGNTPGRLPMPADLISILSTSSVSRRVTALLSGVTGSSNATTALSTETYENTLTADEGKSIENVVVTMGGVDVTDTVWSASNHKVTIANPTGDIVIFATAI